MDLRQAGLVEHKGLPLGIDAVNEAVGHAPGQQIAFPVQRQTHDVGLRAVEEDHAFPRGIDFQDLALVARPGIQIPFGIESQGPDVLRLRLAKDVCLPLGRDAVDFPFRRAAHIEGSVRGGCQGEDVRLARCEPQRPFAIRVHPEDFALMACPDIQVVVPIRSERKGQRLLRVKERACLGGQSQFAVLAQRHIAQGPLQKFIERSDLPKGGFNRP